MTWRKLTSASNNTVIDNTSLAVTAGSAVSIGDLICVAVSPGQVHATGVPASAEITDDLGNTYVRRSTIADTTNDQLLETWSCVVTVAGTPVVTAKYDPIPGTTTATNCSLVVEPFKGSDAASTIDGSNAQNQSSPGTGADAVSSGTFTTAKTGVLLFGAFVDTSTGNDPGVHGTNFIDGTASGGVVLRTQYRTPGAGQAGQAVTFTATTGTDRFIAAGHAITPAASPSAGYYLQEDGTSKYQEQDASGFYLIEPFGGTASLPPFFVPDLDGMSSGRFLGNRLG